MDTEKGDISIENLPTTKGQKKIKNNNTINLPVLQRSTNAGFHPCTMRDSTQEWDKGLAD